MFKKAARLKLRFSSSKGPLSSEDLWDLSLSRLNTIAKALNRDLKLSQEEDFLVEKSEEDKIEKLKFDIVIDILNIKKAERAAAKDASVRSAEKQKILNVLQRKQDSALEDLTEEELKARLEAI